VCEEGFRSGAIAVLVATSTVATGVNLPAQRVIIRDSYIGQTTNTLNATRFRQMCGRAGRAGIDSKGEAIVMLSSKAPAAHRLVEAFMTCEVRSLSYKCTLVLRAT
jgi:replicative superfamily II helicase